MPNLRRLVRAHLHLPRSLKDLRTSKFSPLSLGIFIAIFGCVGLFILLSRAATTPPTIYLSPATQTVGPSGTFTIQVRENSGTTGVNALQANFSYPASLLTCTGIDTSSSAFGVQAQASCSNGQVLIGLGVTGGNAPLTGDQPVATVTFAPATTSGTATLAFTSGTALVSASTNQDILGSLAATTGATYTVDATPPTVSITAPANNATVNVGTVNITASATDASGIAKVDIYVDGTLKTTLTTSPYTYAWAAPLGSHTIQAKATDAFGNVGTSSSVAVTVADLTPPTVSLTAPASSTILSGTVTVSATASDNVGVAGVQFMLDGAALGAEDTASPYTMSWTTTTASNGSHTLTAVARDAAGNKTTSNAVTVTVDNAAPTVSITAPTAGSTVNGTVSITATAADNTGGSGVAKVEFYVDGVLSATITTSPYAYSWDTSKVTNAAHTLVAKAYDKASPANVGTSTSISVTVNNPDKVPPTTPGSFQATSSSTTSATLSWSASTDNVGVAGYQIKRNGTLISTTTSLTYTDSGLTASTTYSYTVAAVDAAGNVSTPAGPVTVTTPTPIPGDINGDQVVNIIDLSILLSNFGGTSPSSDINHDGIVNVLDLSILLSHYGQ